MVDVAQKYTCVDVMKASHIYSFSALPSFLCGRDITAITGAQRVRRCRAQRYPRVDQSSIHSLVLQRHRCRRECCWKRRCDGASFHGRNGRVAEGSSNGKCPVSCGGHLSVLRGSHVGGSMRYISDSIVRGENADTESSSIEERGT